MNSIKFDLPDELLASFIHSHRLSIDDILKFVDGDK